jgi:hypothetical protein
VRCSPVGAALPASRKVSVALEETGLPCEAHRVGFESSEQLTSEFLSLNPNNEVPAILDPEGPDRRPWCAAWATRRGPRAEGRAAQVRGTFSAAITASLPRSARRFERQACPTHSGESTMTNLLAAHRHATNNRGEIEASRVCGCFCCMQLFPPTEIVAWTGLDAADFDNLDAMLAGTALCPHCGSESVIGDKSGFPIDGAFLGRMNEAWFQRTIIRPPSAKK